MAMSNAERQRRYRQNLKSRASGDALGDRVRDAAERAVLALWAFHERPAPSGLRWSDIDGCTTLASYRGELQRAPGNLLQACRAFLPDFEGLTEDEARAIRTVIDIADGLRLSAQAWADDMVTLPRAAA
jgi:hypothetical protein